MNRIHRGSLCALSIDCWPLVAVLALVLLPGCQDKEPADDAEIRGPAPIRSAAADAQAPSPQETMAGLQAPLRRTPEAQTPADGLDWLALAVANARPTVSFQIHSAQGKRTLSARTLGAANPVAPSPVLQGLEFQKQDNGTWTREILPKDDEAFRARMASEAQSAQAGIDERLERLRAARRLNLNPASERDWAAGRLVYTGQPLDIAFSDTRWPLCFVAVESGGATAYLRTGRLSVGDSGLLLEGLPLTGLAPAAVGTSERLRPRRWPRLRLYDQQSD